MNELAMNQMSGMNPFMDFDDEDEEFDPLEDLANMFGDMFVEEDVPNPKYKIGSSVRVKKKTMHDEIEGLNMKDWEGRIERVFRSMGQVFYRVAFDSITLQQLEADTLDFFTDEDVDFEFFDFRVSDLAASKPRDTVSQAIATYRTEFHTRNWELYGDDEAELMEEIMLQFPAKTDAENWEYWFQENLEFPFDVKLRGYFPRSGKTGTVVGLHKVDAKAGQLVLVKAAGFVMDHPLFDLDCKKKGKNALAIEMYHEWLDTDELFS